MPIVAKLKIKPNTYIMFFKFLWYRFWKFPSYFSCLYVSSSNKLVIPTIKYLDKNWNTTIREK